jgi:hypothetical protein
MEIGTDGYVELLSPQVSSIQGRLNPQELLYLLSEAGIHLLPADLDADFLKMPLKATMLERKLHKEMASVAHIMQISGSVWNRRMGPDTVVVQMRPLGITDPDPEELRRQAEEEARLKAEQEAMERAKREEEERLAQEAAAKAAKGKSKKGKGKKKGDKKQGNKPKVEEVPIVEIVEAVPEQEEIVESGPQFWNEWHRVMGDTEKFLISKHEEDAGLIDWDFEEPELAGHDSHSTLKRAVLARLDDSPADSEEGHSPTEQVRKQIDDISLPFQLAVEQVFNLVRVLVFSA